MLIFDAFCSSLTRFAHLREILLDSGGKAVPPLDARPCSAPTSCWSPSSCVCVRGKTSSDHAMWLQSKRDRKAPWLVAPRNLYVGAALGPWLHPGISSSLFFLPFLSFSSFLFSDVSPGRVQMYSNCRVPCALATREGGLVHCLNGEETDLAS